MTVWAWEELRSATRAEAGGGESLEQQPWLSLTDQPSPTSLVKAEA